MNPQFQALLSRLRGLRDSRGGMRDGIMGGISRGGMGGLGAIRPVPVRGRTAFPMRSRVQGPTNPFGALSVNPSNSGVSTFQPNISSAPNRGFLRGFSGF